MKRFFQSILLVLLAVSLLASSAALANEAPPAAVPTLRTLGFCLVPTDDYKEFCHNKSLNLLRGAAIQKITGKVSTLIPPFFCRAACQKGDKVFL